MKTLLLRNVVLLMSVVVVFGCKNNAKTENVSENVDSTRVEAISEDCSTVHWGYEGHEAPENWPNLCSAFTPCGGESQSPINIENPVTGTSLTALDFEYTTTPVNIVNNGHTVQFNVSDGSKLIINGKEYTLLQYHFHGLSEHTVGGEHYPLEVHFVHKHADNDFAVVGIFFKEGEENALFKQYLEKFPKTKGDYSEDAKIDLMGLLPKDQSYYYYSGSLTTPPCSEIVSWYVLSTPLTASAEQIAEFSEILHSNYRPVMPLNDRIIYSFQN
ncbi:MAG: carbonic anhydrase family protein [Bacteroidales bacterium]|nr:carbonic anhydrase family protein [Bacteroidales bacterium]